MSSPNRPTIFPPDGNWAEKESFLKMALELARPEAVMVALHVLRPVFTEEWGKAMHAQELASPGPPPHPFMRHYFQRGGIRALVELGLALCIAGSPPELTHDLTKPERFRSRSREIIAAAFFRHLGAELTFIPETRGPKRPEFIATLDGTEIGVEVKGLSYGRQEQLHDDCFFLIMSGMQGSLASLPAGRSSLVGFEVDCSLIESLAHNLPGPYDDAAHLGRELGLAWSRLIESEALPGTYPGPLGATLTILPPGSDNGLQWSINRSYPSPSSYVGRLRRLLKNAAKKLAESRTLGVVVIEPPASVSRWPAEVVDELARHLRANHPWTKDIAAVLLSETLFFAKHRDELEYGSDLRVLPGKRWGELPQPLQLRWSVSCQECGHVHDHFDVVTRVAALLSSEALQTQLEVWRKDRDDS